MAKRVDDVYLLQLRDVEELTFRAISARLLSERGITRTGEGLSKQYQKLKRAQRDDDDDA